MSPMNNTPAEEDNKPGETIHIRNKKATPSPIFVRGIINFCDLCQRLIELTGVDNFYCKSSTDY